MLNIQFLSTYVSFLGYNGCTVYVLQVCKKNTFGEFFFEKNKNSSKTSLAPKVARLWSQTLPT